MIEDVVKTVKIFYCYAYEDRELRELLEAHLAGDTIEGWHDQLIKPGENRTEEIEKNLRSSDIVLFLISAFFMKSDVERAMIRKIAEEMRQQGKIYVIPVSLRAMREKNMPFSALQILPSGGMPVTSWQDRDEAFKNVAEGIYSIVNDVLVKRQSASTQKKQYVDQAVAAYARKDYEDAVVLYDQAIQLAPQDARLYLAKGDILCQHLQRYDDALFSYKLAIEHGQHDGATYYKMGQALHHLERLQEALAGYDQALQHGYQSIDLYQNKAEILAQLQRYQEALAACTRALALRPQDVTTAATLYGIQGEMQHKLKMRPEALKTYVQVVILGHENARLYKEAGDFLQQERHPNDALLAYRKALQALKSPQSDPSSQVDLFELYVQIGTVLFAQGHHQETLRLYDEAINAYPARAAHFWYNKGVYLMLMQRYDDALYAYISAISVKDGNAHFYWGKGQALLKLERYQDALEAFAQAIYYDPTLIEAYEDTAKVHEQLALVVREQARQLIKEKDAQAKISQPGKGPNVLNLISRTRQLFTK